MNKLLQVAADTFGVPISSLSFETSRGGIKQWDSMGHLCLVAAVEEVFGVCIPMDEVNTIRSLNDFKKFLASEQRQ